jgi:hypothetical protein
LPSGYTRDMVGNFIRAGISYITIRMSNLKVNIKKRISVRL